MVDIDVDQQCSIGLAVLIEDIIAITSPCRGAVATDETTILRYS
jgi:hypothetical protein